MLLYKSWSTRVHLSLKNRETLCTKVHRGVKAGGEGCRRFCQNVVEKNIPEISGAKVRVYA